jgi:hypothetical protein
MDSWFAFGFNRIGRRAPEAARRLSVFAAI